MQRGVPVSYVNWSFDILDYVSVLKQNGVRFSRGNMGLAFMYWRTRPGQPTEATRVVFL
jgi:hypothetical protein